jgi:hypothetical protein
MRFVVKVRIPVEKFNLEFHPCMTPQDLGAAGLDTLGKRYSG